jgi:hypothetical protein
MCLDAWWRTSTGRRARHGILATGLALLTACGSGKEQSVSPDSSSESSALHVYNWADYIGESTIRDFETRSGTKVTYDVFDSPEMLSTKLLTGRSGYDVVFPSAVHLRRDAPAGVFLKLDKSKLPNLANMDPAIMKVAEKYDPAVNWATHVDMKTGRPQVVAKYSTHQNGDRPAPLPGVQRPPHVRQGAVGAEPSRLGHDRVGPGRCVGRAPRETGDRAVPQPETPPSSHDVIELQQQQPLSVLPWRAEV